MEKAGGNRIMRGCGCDDPNRLAAPDDLIYLIEKIGFLPLFANAIPGFSAEEHTLADDWWTGNPTSDPWEWRVILADSDEIAYGKFFHRKAGFISKKWFPAFANYRRNGYDFDALFDDELAPIRSKRIMDAFHPDERMRGERLTLSEIAERTGEKERAVELPQTQTYLIVGGFQRRRSKTGKPFGLPSGVYLTPETKWDYNFVTGEYPVSPSQSWRRITEQIKKAYPGANDEQILTVLGIRYPDSPAPVVPVVKKVVKKKRDCPARLPYPENLITALGLKHIFGAETYTPLTEDQIAGLEYALGSLTDKERKAIRLRFEEHYTLAKIGECFQRSDSRIGQVIGKALRKLRQPVKVKYYRDGYAATMEARTKLKRKIAAALENGDGSYEWAEGIRIYELELSSGTTFNLVTGGVDNLAKLLTAINHPENPLALKNFSESHLSELKRELRNYAEDK